NRRAVGSGDFAIIDVLFGASCPEFVRKWWNWQTHHLEGVAPKGVGVQVPPSAPSRFCRGALRKVHGKSKERSPGRVAWAQARMTVVPILITVIHVVVCVFLIGVVLLQSGKS